MRLLLPLLLLVSCGPFGAPRDPGPCPQLPCDLLLHPEAWAPGGLAASVVAGLPEAPERTDLLVDFEVDEGTFGGGPGGEYAGEPGTRRLVLTTQERDRPWWQSAPVPVEAGRRYALAWRTANFGVRPPKRLPKLKAGVSVEFYAVPKQVEDPAAFLADATNRRRTRRQLEKGAHWRPAEGSAPWGTEFRSFRPLGAVTHLLVRVGGPPAVGGGVGTRLEVDDLSLRSSPAPAWADRGRDTWQDPGAHPLQWRARGEHDAHRHANEIRDLLLAPAPSTLRQALVVPEGAQLDLGYGLSRGETGPPVTFEATLLDDDGVRHVLHRASVKAPRKAPWQDARVDLTAWAGESVTLELKTSGREAPADPLAGVARQPEGRAGWTRVRLEPSTPGRLVVLVIVDTLGAHHASGWKGKRNTTPNLQRIGAEGTLYAEARAPAPWTLPSVASYLTGLSPDVHGAGEQLGRDHYARRPVSAATDTLAERLRAEGWDTRAWINNTFLTSQITGLDQGFGSYLDYGSRTERGGSKVGMDLVVDELRRPAGDRFLLVHLMDPHLPYKPPQEYIDRFVDPAYRGPLKNGKDYKAVKALWRMKLKPKKKGRKHLRELHEAAVAFADSEVGRVYDAAKASGQEMLFIVTSDHGEEFWEHGFFDHGHSLFDELLHVPLVLHRTGQEPAVVSSNVDVTGVFGSVLDFAGIDRGEAPALTPVDAAVPTHARPTLYGVRQRSVERDGWKYILRHPHTGRRHRRVRPDPQHLLFDRTTDPDETVDRLAAAPERAVAMHRAVVEEALTGQSGAWYAWVGPGEEPVEFTWTMTGGDGWHPDITDFPWPRADGQPVERQALRVKRESTDATSTVRLRVQQRPTLVLLSPKGQEGEVQVQVGGSEPRPILEATSSAALLAGLESSAPSVGRLAGTLRGRAGGNAPDAADLEALRALGYVD